MANMFFDPLFLGCMRMSSMCAHAGNQSYLWQCLHHGGFPTQDYVLFQDIFLPHAFLLVFFLSNFMRTTSGVSRQNSRAIVALCGAE